MRLRLVVCCAAVVVVACLGGVSSTGAIGVTPYDSSQTKTDSPVIITGYSFQGPRVSYAQLFNTSDEIVDLKNWQLQYTIAGQTTPVTLGVLTGLLKPSSYILVADSSFIPSADFTYSLTIPAEVTANAASISLQPATSYLTHTVPLTADVRSNYWKRNISTSTGNFLSTFSWFVPPTPFTL